MAKKRWRRKITARKTSAAKIEALKTLKRKRVKAGEKNQPGGNRNISNYLKSERKCEAAGAAAKSLLKTEREETSRAALARGALAAPERRSAKIKRAGTSGFGESAACG